MKIHLGKTATSRTRKKVVEQTTSKISLPQDNFTNYLLSKNYSSTTIESFLTDVRKFKAWLEKESLEIEAVSYNDITSYMQSFETITQKTKGCYIRGVKQYFNFLIERNEVQDNPVEFIQLKGLKRKTLYDILNRQELDRLYMNYILPDEPSKHKNQIWFRSQQLAHKRNKVIVGLMLYQALDTRDLKLSVHDIKLREGKIFIPGTRKSNERELKLESLQIMDIMEYLQTTRKEILQLAGKNTEKLFPSIGTSERFANIMVYLMERLHKINPKVLLARQLKASVIVHWLKLYNLRQVQYMAGHRYVSSTESFLVNEMDEMIGDIEKYHPF